MGNFIGKEYTGFHRDRVSAKRNLVLWEFIHAFDRSSISIMRGWFLQEVNREQWMDL